MKRVFWASSGYALGLGSSIWLQRRVRRTVEQYAPEQVRRQVADRGSDLAARTRRTIIDLREAASEGVAAMRESELELRAEFSPLRPPVAAAETPSAGKNLADRLSRPCEPTRSEPRSSSSSSSAGTPISRRRA